MSILTPRGFLFSVTEAGIKYSGRNDMALICSEGDATVSALFTRNRVKAAPVILDRARLRYARTARAIVVNSGNANACTGRRGLRDAERICAEVAKGLCIRQRDVLVSSTGVIGTPMPMERVISGIRGLVENLGKRSIEDVASAIMTTDTFPKAASREINRGNIKGRIAAVAKGAGMIAPDMATMLCFIITDLAVEYRALKAALKDAVGRTFNLLTVDGEMSTNDSVFIMANGAAGNRPITHGGRYFNTFGETLFDLCDELSRMIARDGEGATRLLIIKVKRALTHRDARVAALKVANSPLVKTAIYGNDANWGRIMASVGSTGIRFSEEKVSIKINGIEVARRGCSTGRDSIASEAMKTEEVVVEIDLGAGRYEERVYSCDLTEGYITINAEYRT